MPTLFRKIKCKLCLQNGEIDLILICHYVAVELTVSKGLDAVVTSSKENRIFRIKN